MIGDNSTNRKPVAINIHLLCLVSLMLVLMLSPASATDIEKSPISGLKLKKLGGDSLFITEGFEYHQGVETSIPADLTVTGSEDGKIIAKGRMGYIMGEISAQGGTPTLGIEVEDQITIEYTKTTAYF